MSDTTAAWRAALNDEADPRHKIAWALFPAVKSMDRAARRLADQQETVLGYLYQVLDEPALYEETALGKGQAPLNAMKLLGHWGVVEAAPRLLAILDEREWTTDAHDAALSALSALGPPIIEQVLAFAGSARLTTEGSLAAVLAALGEGDARAFAWVKDALTRQQTDLDIVYMARMLLDIDRAAAVPFLKQRLKEQSYSEQARAGIKSAIDGPPSRRPRPARARRR